MFSAALSEPTPAVRVRHKWAIVLGALTGVAALIVGAWLYYSKIELKPLLIPPQSLVAAAGSGRWVDGVIEIVEADEQNRATFIATVAPFPADLYDSVSWQIPGFPSAAGGALLWISDQGREGQVFVRRLTLPDVRDGRLSMRGDPDWRGSISRVGVMIQGPFQQPVRVVGLQIEPRVAEVSVEESIGLVAKSWSKPDPWNGGSLNFLGVAIEGQRYTPVAWIAIWVSVAVVVAFAILWGMAARTIATVAVAIALSGWFALDLRWQLQLIDNITSGLEKPETLSNVAADRKLSELAAQIPVDNSRIFVLSDEPGSYAPLRARYLLAPHRVHVGFRSFTELSMLKPGDHVLVVSTPEKLQFDQGNRQLLVGERRIAAELVASDIAFGSLFKITGVP